MHDEVIWQRMRAEVNQIGKTYSSHNVEQSYLFCRLSLDFKLEELMEKGSSIKFRYASLGIKCDFDQES